MLDEPRLRLIAWVSGRAIIGAMTDEAGHQRYPGQGPGPKSVRFAELSGEVLAALLDRDLAAASTAAGVPLTGYFITPEALKLWRLQPAR